MSLKRVNVHITLMTYFMRQARVFWTADASCPLLLLWGVLGASALCTCSIWSRVSQSKFLSVICRWRPCLLLARVHVLLVVHVGLEAY